MRNREGNRQLLSQIGKHLGLEAQIATTSGRNKQPAVERARAEIEWRLPLASRVDVSLVRQLVPELPESLPLAGFVLADDSDQSARDFSYFANLSGQRYPFAFLITEGASAYRRGHRSLRTFRHLFGACQCLVADMQQLHTVAKQLAADSDGSSEALPELQTSHPVVHSAASEKAGAPATTWTRQLKIWLRQKGQQAGLDVSENALPVDFARQFDSGRNAFATLKRYLQPVLLEEVGHALGYYHSYKPLNNRPPRVSTSWQKQFAAIRTDVTWELPVPAGLLRFLHLLLDCDSALRHAVPLLQGPMENLPLVGFIIERTIGATSAGRILMLGRGCRFGVVIVAQTQLGAAQQLFAILGRTVGLANVSIMARQQLIDGK